MYLWFIACATRRIQFLPDSLWRCWELLACSSCVLARLFCTLSEPAPKNSYAVSTIPQINLAIPQSISNIIAIAFHKLSRVIPIVNG